MTQALAGSRWQWPTIPCEMDGACIERVAGSVSVRRYPNRV